MKSIHTTSTRKADYIIPDCIDHQIKQPLSKIAVNERTVGANCAFSHRVFWISAKNSNFVCFAIHSNLKIDYAQQNDSRRSARH